MSLLQSFVCCAFGERFDGRWFDARRASWDACGGRKTQPRDRPTQRGSFVANKRQIYSIYVEFIGFVQWGFWYAQSGVG